ncbi:hypothetical protein Tsubulata_041103 [Turnera subulata]|uniref:Thiol-disulfide oxidoreductase DCC n=1 Tax=Turnera subulata TaxID=218843 RepID=A0A9Q0G3F3_9ROSI|nr:hypothetical protein Tsubulata_041103 [Turnera subulata]
MAAATTARCIARQSFRFHQSPSLCFQSLASFTPPTPQIGCRPIRAIHGTTVDPATREKGYKEQDPPQDWKIKMLYDGDCPLCMREVMGRIHAILSDGTVVTDVEAFRRLYEQVGLGWVYAITKYKPVAILADSVYSVWAKYRLQITGRPPLEEILEARKNKGEIYHM